MLALTNWIALFITGEVSLQSDPLGSLYLPRPAISWALQLGAIALAESYLLQQSTNYVIRQA